MYAAAPDRYRLFHVDAFTREYFQGNSAGVVVDARGLPDQQMQRIAAELRHSETAFVLPPHSNDHDVHVRFFSPTCEIPDCGHATVAAHYVLTRLGKRPLGPYRQKTGVGIRTVEVKRVDGDFRQVIHQSAPRFANPLTPKQMHEVAAAIGVGFDALVRNSPTLVASTGRPKLLVPLREQQTLDKLVPNQLAIERICRCHECSGLIAFTLPAIGDQIEVESRHFAPLLGIAEDPVTGNGNGPLGAYLVEFDLVPSRASPTRIIGRQGRSLGRPGIVHIEVDHDGASPTGVRIGGDAIIVFDSLVSRHVFEERYIGTTQPSVRTNQEHKS